MSSAVDTSTVVCVLGMSRTGTSLTTRVLSLAGVYLGPEDELLQKDLHQLAGEGESVLARARDTNPEGFWEHYRIMRLNERVLRALGGSWRDPPQMPSGWESSDDLIALADEARSLLAESFAGHDLWGWKDPRNSLTLPFWQRLVPTMRYVVCLRNPADVAASLQRRDEMPIDQGLELWREYVNAALVGTAGWPRLLVPYEDFFVDRTRTAARLARFVGRPGAFDDGATESRLVEAVDERLWRNRAAACGEEAAGGLPDDIASLQRLTQHLLSVQNGGDAG
jgi:hypothetical protein